MRFYFTAELSDKNRKDGLDAFCVKYYLEKRRIIPQRKQECLPLTNKNNLSESIDITN